MRDHSAKATATPPRAMMIRPISSQLPKRWKPAALNHSPCLALSKPMTFDSHFASTKPSHWLTLA
jgi:hypothetical protein